MKAAGRLVIAAVAALCLVGSAPPAAAGGPPPVDCMRTEKPPAPPPGGAVVAGPLKAGPSPNVVVIPAGASWTPTGFCASAEVAMAHPSSIKVGAGGALLLEGAGAFGYPPIPTHMTSAWGAADDASNPVLYQPDPAKWQKTTEIRAVEPKYLLDRFDSCRYCDLQHVDFDREDPTIKIAAYWADLEGAHLQDSTLRGNLGLFNFSQADLSDANLSGANLWATRFDRTRVDGTNFDGANLMGTQMNALRFDRPPHLAKVVVGGAPVCTLFKDTDLSGSRLTLGEINIRSKYGNCTQTPMLPGSSVPLGVLAQAVRLGGKAEEKLDFDGATFVASAGDRSVLAGADLTGQTLKRVRFLGFPANFVKTDFSRDQLLDADLDGADLSGADFDNAKLAGASFRGADLAERGDLGGATFAGATTDLSRANFIDADISGASFVGADLSAAVFSHVLAEDTNFNGVRAPNAAFTGAHVYGNGQAFDSADNLRGADFSRAVLAGNVDQNGGFNFTHSDLAGANFDGVQCIGCNFTRSTLDDVNFIGAYLPGAIFTDVQSMSGARFHDAWLYCGDRVNSGCPTVGGSADRWQWALGLGSGEDYGPVPFRQTNLGTAPFKEVATCPDGKRGSSPPAGCEAPNLLPASNHAPPIPAPCSAAGPGACPTPTSTLSDTGAARPGTPIALAAASPANWAGTNAGRGVYAALGDGTIRRLQGHDRDLVAGSATFGEVTGLAVGVDGSLYVAEGGSHRIRRIEPSGRITTVAGGGRACDPGPSGDCGNGGPATKAELAGPFGIWVDPEGRIYIADGKMGVREVGLDGKIGSVVAERPDVHGIVGDSAGALYATTDDALLKIDLKDKVVKRVVGTGSPGYNGNKTKHGTLAPGTEVQVDRPTGLSVARDGDVLFADSGNGLIRAFVPSSGHVIDALAGVVANGSPQPGFNGDGHFARETQLSTPGAVAALPNEEFVVADAGNRRVRKFGPGPR